MRRLTHLPLVAAAALFGLAACSNDSTSSATSLTVDPAITDDGSGTDDTGVDVTGSDVTGSDDTLEQTPVGTIDPAIQGAGDGTPFCDVNDELNEGGPPLDTATPDEIEEYFNNEFPELLARLVEVTPPELEADVDVLLDGIVRFGEVLEDNDWDMDAAIADPAMSSVIGSEAFNLAGQRVDAYCSED